MRKNIKKIEFLELCYALESGIINTEQFYTLSSKEHDVAISVVGVLKLLKTKFNKDMFDILCNSSNYNNIYQILKMYEVYRIDPIRQQFIIENHDNIAIFQIAKILQNDNIWNDKEFVKILLDKSTKIMDFLDMYRVVDTFLISNEDVFNNAININIIKKIVNQNNNSILILLDCLKVASLQENQLWFDYLIDYYNKEKVTVNYRICFESFEKAGCMEKLTQKLMEINNEDNNIELFSNFFKNIVSIRDFSDRMSEEEKEEYQREFDLLLQYSTEEPDKFFIIRELAHLILERKLATKDLKNICYKIASCKNPNVQSLVLEIYKDYSTNFIDDNVINKVFLMSYDEAKNYLLKRAIEINEQNYIAKEIKYYGESFSDSFISCIDKGDLTKEELLVIRDKVLRSTSAFDGQEFIIDTTSFINGADDGDISNENTSLLSTKTDFSGDNNHQKSKILSLKDKGCLKKFFGNHNNK